MRGVTKAQSVWWKSEEPASSRAGEVWREGGNQSRMNAVEYSTGTIYIVELVELRRVAVVADGSVSQSVSQSVRDDPHRADYLIRS